MECKASSTSPSTIPTPNLFMPGMSAVHGHSSLLAVSPNPPTTCAQGRLVQSPIVIDIHIGIPFDYQRHQGQPSDPAPRGPRSGPPRGGGGDPSRGCRGTKGPWLFVACSIVSKKGIHGPAWGVLLELGWGFLDSASPLKEVPGWLQLF